jgi:AsmA protein
MKIWIRRLALGLGVLLVLLGATAVYLVATFDPNRYQGLLIDWMRENRQRTLAIGAPIELTVFPRLGVKLAKVSLSEHRQPDEFAAFDEATLSVDLLPLLRKQLVIDRVQAKGVRLAYQRDAQGRSNIDDLLASDTKDRPAEQPARPGEPLAFDVGGIDLEQLRATVRDAKAGFDGELVIARLKTGRLANGIESNIELAAKLAMKQPRVAAALEGSLKLTPELGTGSAKARDIKLALKGEVPAASGLDMLVTGAAAYDGASGAVQADKLDVKLAALQTAGLRLKDSSASIQRFDYQPAGKVITLDALKLQLAGQRASGEPVALRLDWPQLGVQGASLKGSALQGEFSMSGTTTVKGRFSSQAPAGSFDELRLPGVQFEFDGSSGARKLAGQARAELRIKPAAGELAVEALNLQSTAQDPALQPLKVALTGRAQATARSALWALAGSINNNDFTTRGNANLAGDVPHVQADARFEALDLNRLLPGAMGPKPGAASAPLAAQPADTPIDLSPLRSLTGRFNVQAGQLAVKQYRLADARIEASLDGGMLRVPVLTAQAWGGRFDAKALADARASRITVQGTAQGVNINAMLKDVAQYEKLEGTGRVTVDLDTAGKSVGEMRSRLAGTAAMQLRDGAVRGVNLAKSLRQAKAALGLQKDEMQKAQQAEKTDFSEMNMSFQIADGVARSTDLDAKSPLLRAGGAGSIDLGRERIDYVARATVVGTSKGQDGAELAALKGLTIPVHLTGPLDAVAWQIQWSQVAVGAAEATLKNKAEEKLKEKLGEKLGLKPPAPAGGASGAASSPQDAARDKLKEKLKGLFK